MKKLNSLLTAAAMLCFSAVSMAQITEVVRLPPQGVDVIGMVRQVQAGDQDTLLDIGRHLNVGGDAMRNANPGVDFWYPGAGSNVLVPTRYILPDVPREGIVVNLPEMRLYYFDKQAQTVRVYAIGIGREGRDTPLGVQAITEMRRNPTWTPPASIRAEHAAQGHILPAVVPAGPDNPLATRAMRLTNPSYLIHGTAKPWGVGMRVSSGCIRMYPEGVEELFELVGVGTKVNILKEEMKVGWFGDELYLEYHPPFEEDNISSEQAMYEAIDLVNRKAAQYGLTVEENVIRAVVNEATGMPVSVAYQRHGM